MINWLMSAWKGKAKALPTFLLLVVAPWGVSIVVGNTLGFAKLFAFGFKLHPVLSIPLGVFIFAFEILGILCYWRSAFNCSRRWYGYVGRLVAGIRMLELLSRLLLAGVILVALFPKK